MNRTDPPMRRFEHEESGSKKFWQVSVSAADLTVTFGRVGTAGQTKTKSLGSPEAAAAEAGKLVREKTSKGYVEVTAPDADVPAASTVAPTPAPSPAVPRASDEFLSWLRTTQPGGPTKAWRLLTLARNREDLPERVVEALMSDQIDGSFWFTAHDVLEWLGTNALPSARRVPADFFVRYLDDGDRAARNRAASALAVASPTRALDAAGARLGSKKATDRETGLVLAFRVFSGPGADPSAARSLLPQLAAAAATVKGKMTDFAKAAVDAATALASRVDTSGLPDRDDLATLAAGASGEPEIAGRLLLGCRTVSILRGSHARDCRLD